MRRQGALRLFDEREFHLDAGEFDDVTVFDGIGLRAYRHAVHNREVVIFAVTLDVSQEITLRAA